MQKRLIQELNVSSTCKTKANHCVIINICNIIGQHNIWKSTTWTKYASVAWADPASYGLDVHSWA